MHCQCMHRCAAVKLAPFYLTRSRAGSSFSNLPNISATRLAARSIGLGLGGACRAGLSTTPGSPAARGMDADRGRDGGVAGGPAAAAAAGGVTAPSRAPGGAKREPNVLAGAVRRLNDMACAVCCVQRLTKRPSLGDQLTSIERRCFN